MLETSNIIQNQMPQNNSGMNRNFFFFLGVQIFVTLTMSKGIFFPVQTLEITAYWAPVSFHPCNWMAIWEKSPVTFMHLVKAQVNLHNHTFCFSWLGGWVRWRCPVAFVTGAPNWYWPTVGQGLLSLQQVRVEGECYFFCSFFHFPLSSLSISIISSTTCVSSISFLPFSGRRHKMTHKGWHVVKPQHNVSVEG